MQEGGTERSPPGRRPLTGTAALAARGADVAEATEAPAQRTGGEWLPAGRGARLLTSDDFRRADIERVACGGDGSIGGGVGRARAGARLALGAAGGPRAAGRAGPQPTLAGLCAEEASAPPWTAWVGQLRLVLVRLVPRV